LAKEQERFVAIITNTSVPALIGVPEAVSTTDCWPIVEMIPAPEKNNH
jgi:hypothetical protein